MQITSGIQNINFSLLNPPSSSSETSGMSFPKPIAQPAAMGDLTKKSFSVLNKNELRNLNLEQKKIEEKLNSSELTEDQRMCFELTLEKIRVRKLEHCLTLNNKQLEETEKRLESAEVKLSLIDGKNQYLLEENEELLGRKRALEKENEKALVKVMCLETRQKGLTTTVENLEEIITQLEERSEIDLAVHKLIEMQSQDFSNHTKKVSDNIFFAMNTHIFEMQKTLREKDEQIECLENNLQAEVSLRESLEKQLATIYSSNDLNLRDK